MNLPKYQHFVMWKANHSQRRKPTTLSAYMEEHKLSIKQINEFMNHETFSQDLNKATRFLMTAEFPDLMWSLFDKVKAKQSGKDLESLAKLLFNRRIITQTEDDQEVFSDLGDEMTPEQKKYFLEMLKDGEET